MIPLAEFVLARIAEDEAEARRYQSYQENVYEAGGWWDCDRVLAECAAKRRLLDWADQGGNHFVLCQLAAPYEGHPAYCDEWAEGPRASYGD